MHLPRLIAIILIVLTLPGTTFGDSGESKTLRLASDIWPPFTNVEDKTRRAIDLVETALSHNKVSSQTRIISWDKVITGLRNKTIDGCAAMWHSAEREQFLLFSKPYLENRLILVGRAGSAVDGLKISKLQGKRLALVRGYAYGSILDHLKDVTVVFGESDAANLESVLGGKADYLLADELLIHRLFEKYPEKSQQLLAAGSTPLITRALHFVIRKDHPDARKIIRAFNQSIKQLMANGTYNRLLKLAWIRTDVGDNGVEDYVSSGSIQPKAPKSGTGYRLFLNEPYKTASKEKGAFIIDGEKYNSWDEASRRLNSFKPKQQEKTPDQDEAGLVLLRF